MAFDSVEDLVLTATKRKLDGLPAVMVAYYPLAGFGDDDDDDFGFGDDEGVVIDERHAAAAALALEKTGTFLPRDGERCVARSRAVAVGGIG